MNKINFSCTACGRCCHDLRLTLGVNEATRWLQRGGDVEVMCHAAPEVGDVGLIGAYRSARSFFARSGELPIRVQVILAARFGGACPNLLPDMRCGIYQERPNVCRIYPAEIVPGIPFRTDGKLCPPEAWSDRQPEFLTANGRVMDSVTEAAIEAAQTAGLSDVGVRRLLTEKLGIRIAALENEGFAVWSVPPDRLLDVLMEVVGGEGQPLESSAGSDWQFVSMRSSTVELITSAGARVTSNLQDDYVTYLPLYESQPY